MNRVKLLSELLISYARENGPEAIAIANKIIIDETERKDRFEQNVTGIIYDGLAYGNWPWIINKPL